MCSVTWPAAWTARIAGRRPRISSIARATSAPIRMAEKAIWRIGACMSVRRRRARSVFRRSSTIFEGISSWRRARTDWSQTEQLFYTVEPPVSRLPTGATRGQTPYAELHCHTNFSFLDGASAPDELVERAVELGLTGLAVTDHNGLYGAVRFAGAAEAAGLHPVIGVEIELLDAAVAGSGPDRRPGPPSRPRGGRRAGRGPGEPGRRARREGVPRPAPPDAGPAARSSASRSRRTCAGSASASAARTSSCSPASQVG